MATTIYLVRHGETEWNRDSKIQGQLDIELSDVGLNQAAQLGKRLSRVPLDAVYSSDLSRALKTAEILAAYHHLDVRLATEFREMHFGEWQGLGREEIDVRFPGSRELLQADPDTFRPPGGESWREVLDRFMTGLDRLADEWPDGRLVVVSHGGSSRMAICSALGIDLKLRWKIRMDNTGISILKREKGNWLIECVNDTCHLDGDLLFGHDD